MSAHALDAGMQQSVLKIQPASADIFDQINDGFETVARAARYVRIRDDRLAEYALSLRPVPETEILDTRHHYVTRDPEAMAAYALSLDAINFGSGYVDGLLDEGWALQDGSIYYTVSTALKTCFDVCGPWSATTLGSLPLVNVQRIFSLPDAPYGRSVASLFTASLNELGILVADRYDGRFMNLVGSCGGLAAGLVSRLAELPGFQDIVNYRGRDFPVFKRAQHAAASLERMIARCTGQPVFADIDRLTMFADNAVPHVLRVDGILEYDQPLAERIDAGAFLPAGSDAEIEIRCCAGAAVSRLAAIRGQRAVEIDYMLWHCSVEDARYAAHPAHRTLTRFY